jgi:hypothetical protein
MVLDQDYMVTAAEIPSVFATRLLSGLMCEVVLMQKPHSSS